MAEMKNLKVEEIRHLRESRDQFSNPMMNFLGNFYILADSIRRYSIRSVNFRPYYVSGMVTALETFFRDLFVYSYAGRPDLFSGYAMANDVKVPLTDILVIQRNNVDWAEYCASRVNFQVLSECEKAFGPLFAGTSWSKKLTDFECAVSIKGKNGQLKTPEDWWPTFNELISLRHALIHDANHHPEISPRFLQKTEAYIVLIPQLCNILWTEILDNHRILITDSNVPALLTIDDLLAEWEIAD